MTILQNYNVYDQDQFEPFFKQTSIYQQLLKKYTLINFDKFYQPFINNNDKFKKGKIKSEPEWWEKTETLRSILLKQGIVDAVPFYYLKYLTDINPEKIYDIACGCNFFKDYIPNLVAISGNPPSSPFFNGDEYGWIDDNYIAQHQNIFPSAFSLVSLHFIPITDVRKRVIDFMSMIRPGGRGFLSMISYEMLIDSANDNILNNLDMYIRTQLYDVPFEYLVVDIDETNRKLLGNIRLVMQK
jgi:hypothetical protein